MEGLGAPAKGICTSPSGDHWKERGKDRQGELGGVLRLHFKLGNILSRLDFDVEGSVNFVEIITCHCFI